MKASQRPVQRPWQPRGCTEHCINAVDLRCGLKTKMCLQRRTLHSFGQNRRSVDKLDLTKCDLEHTMEQEGLRAGFFLDVFGGGWGRERGNVMFVKCQG